MASADVPGVKVTAVARWGVADPVAFLDRSTDPVEELRLAVQLAVLALVTARQEGLAELERARSQTAALRALANGARVLEDSPGLLQLRTAQAAAEGGGTVVVQLLPRG